MATSKKKPSDNPDAAEKADVDSKARAKTDDNDEKFDRLAASVATMGTVLKALVKQAEHDQDVKADERKSNNGAGDYGTSGANLLGTLVSMLDNNKYADDDSNGDGDDMVSNAIAAVMGVGPAFAALESMMAGSASQSAMLMNAVKIQRQLDQVALCTTSACVRQILSMSDPIE